MTLDFRRGKRLEAILVAGKYCRRYAAELCTSCTVSEILGAQRAQNVGQGNLTDT
jgi:hypothetical protein